MNIPRESIFISALRLFFKTIALIVGITIAFILVALGMNAIGDTLSSADKSTMKISADADWNQKLLSDTTPVILRIDVTGIIGTPHLTDKKIKQLLVNSRTGALANNRVKGVLLYVNTPGGTSDDSAAIYRHLKTYKEKFNVPIYAYSNGMCASGGMYIISAADKFYTSPNSIVGSIGVRMGTPRFNVSEVLARHQIQSLTIIAGKDKDMLNPFRPWKEGEADNIQQVIDSEYEQFVSVVTEARPIDKEQLINEYGAHIFSAKEGEELGFCDDSNMTYDDALRAVVAAAGIKQDEKYQVVIIEPTYNIWQNIKENQLLKGRIEHTLYLDPSLPNELHGKMLFLHQS